MSYVGCGQGQYIQETTYKYVGCGGDFDAVRPRRDFTCLITTCCLLSLLTLLPLLLWLFSGTSYDCSMGASNPATHASSDATPVASDSTASACWSSCPLQLRSGHTDHVEARQEGLVLQDPPRGLPSANRADADACAPATSRSS